MDIKDLNKTQLILLALLISFVVSIATGIVTVSLMQQMPTKVQQTINRVIQQTIEKVTTVQAPVVKDDTKKTSDFSDANVNVSIYNKDYVPIDTTKLEPGVVVEQIKPLGEGIIISDVGLILIDSGLLTKDEDSYKVMLGKDLFDAKIIKKFGNGFDVLKILPIPVKSDTASGTDAGAQNTKTPTSTTQNPAKATQAQ